MTIERKPENPVLSIIIVVTAVVISVFLLSYVNALTKPKIEKHEKQKLLDSLKKVCPMGDLSFKEKTLSWNGSNWDYYVGKDNSGRFQCAAIITESNQGYGGEIKLLLGVDSTGTIRGVEVLEHHETPGLGARITEESFRKQFIGKNLENTNFTVKKDGGDIQQLTSATISSRAFCGAVKKALEFFQANKSAIVK